MSRANFKTKIMEPLNNDLNVSKLRHGCLTAWLVLVIVVNSLTAFVLLFKSEIITNSLPYDVSSAMIILLGISGIANVIFSIMLFKWKKIGFWGFVFTSLGVLFINLNIGLSIGQSLFGLVAVIILYGILHIKREGVTGWSNLE
jgi:hypothetical protein